MVVGNSLVFLRFFTGFSQVSFRFQPIVLNAINGLWEVEFST